MDIRIRREEREEKEEGDRGDRQVEREGRKEGKGREEGTLVPRHSKESEEAPCAHCLRMHKVPLVTCILLHCTKNSYYCFPF